MKAFVVGLNGETQDKKISKFFQYLKMLESYLKECVWFAERKTPMRCTAHGGWFLTSYLRLSLMAACAAARRAMGTRNGEQDT